MRFFVLLFRLLLWPFRLLFNLIWAAWWLLRALLGGLLWLLGTWAFRALWTGVTIYGVAQMGLEPIPAIVSLLLGYAFSVIGRKSAPFVLPRQSLGSRFRLPAAPQLPRKPVDLAPKKQKVARKPRVPREKRPVTALVSQRLALPSPHQSPTEADALAALPEPMRRIMRP